VTEQTAAEPVLAPASPGMSPETRRVLDVALRIAGLVVATGLGAVSGLIEAFLAPLRFGSFGFVPVSLVLAVITNPALAWFAYAATGRRSVALFPAAAWCTVWFLGATKTAEGDLLITDDNWVGVSTLLSGPIAFALGVFVPVMLETRRILRDREAARRQREAATPSATPSAKPAAKPAPRPTPKKAAAKTAKKTG
jgi:hypothetical protein